MATESVTNPLRNSFPRYHNRCDRCGCDTLPTNGTRNELDTAAGSFKFRLCADCDSALEAMDEADRGGETVRAMVNHANHYSPAFGQFVADWYGANNG